jgi:hypothetical protein
MHPSFFNGANHAIEDFFGRDFMMVRAQWKSWNRAIGWVIRLMPRCMARGVRCGRSLQKGARFLPF